MADYILNIETSTTVCSVALSENQKTLAFREIDNGYTHAENLHVFIDTLLKETAILPSRLSAISVSKGPGSYTGLRIGVSAAKGMAYALNIPLLSVDTLILMAATAKEVCAEYEFYCPMLDARRMEVYTSIYNNSLVAQTETNALILDETSVMRFKQYPSICFFGNGMPKSKTLLQDHAGAKFIETIVPSAIHMGPLSHNKFLEKKFEDVAYFEPFYLKDFMILKKN